MKNDADLSFENNSHDIIDISFGNEWEGYNLNVTLKNLYDERNWCNGTFHYGVMDNYLLVDDDTDWIKNKFQNWTFNTRDITTKYINNMSGNYLDGFEGHDALELRLGGDYINGTGGAAKFGYDEGDACWWNTTFSIPRGRVIDSYLKFDARDRDLMDINAWEFKVYLNDEQIYSIGTYELDQACGGGNGQGSWTTFRIPQEIWTNNSNVYPSIMNDTVVTLNVSLEHTSGSDWYRDFSDRDYQRIYFDNVEIVTKTEVKPEQIKMKINETYINNVGWGEGFVGLNGNWQVNTINLNFSCEDAIYLGGYTIESKADIKLSAIKNAPETNYETNYNSLGTIFSVSNNSVVYWNSYAYISVPDEYIETEMRIRFPEDINITWISTPQDPSTNKLSLCDNSTPGLLIVPVNTISSASNGYWKLNAISYNYLEQITIYNDVSGSWIQNSTFISGDNINITAKLIDSSLISGYRTLTKAQLHIRFPNGTIWNTKNQLKSPDTNGYIYFDTFQIPTSTPYYEVGDYEAIVSWNNSYSTFKMNETGIIYKKFTVIHDSVLETDDGIYYIDNIFNDRVINIKVSFKDKVDNKSITEATIYAKNSTDTTLNFNEISPGFYLLEFDARLMKTGNNSLTIYANATFYLNKKINITIYIIEETILTVDNDFLSGIPYGQNFSVLFNYTEKHNGIGIDYDEFTTDLAGDYYISKISQGKYNLTCNSSGYSPNILYTFTFTVSAYTYETQEKEINILTTELGSSLELFVNESKFEPNDLYTVDVWDKINITVTYKDLSGNHLNAANISLSGIGNLTEKPTFNHYNIIINASILGQGIDYLEVYAEKFNYQPQSIPFIVEITETKTDFQIFLNRENKTDDPNIELTKGTSLNITVKYYELTDSTHIESATVNLTGDFTDTLNENKALEQYSIIIDTNLLDIGVRIITISAKRNNFEVQTDNLRIDIKKVRTEIETEDGEDKIEIEPGESVTIKIVLKDLDFDRKIKGAKVELEWKYGEEDLEETSDGIYEIKLKNVPEGTYTITITADKGNDYDFESYEITLSATRPQEELLLFQILTIVAVVAGVALAGYVILYRKIFKYPKPIRKVRKYRRTLTKKKAPRIDIIEREDGLNKVYEQELGDLSKLFKAKYIIKDNHLEK